MKIDPRGISSIPLPKEKESGQRAEKSGQHWSLQHQQRGQGDRQHHPQGHSAGGAAAYSQ